MDSNDIERVIAEYDATTRRNTTPSYNAMRAVAEDDNGEVPWEVIETAERMGYTPNDNDLTDLQNATNAYQTRLAAELSTEPRPNREAPS